jgi:sugar phosphate permease
MPDKYRSHIALTAFLALFATVGLGLYGLSFFYDFMVKEYGWTRSQVTSGNAVGKILVGPLFGFFAGWLIDRFGPRRLMLAGLLSGGLALVGLGSIATLPLFYAFFVMNSLGYVCGGPLPNQVLLARWFDRRRGIAMGFAYLGIGIGGAVAPRLAHYLTVSLGWHAALMTMGGIFLLISMPLAIFVKDAPPEFSTTTRKQAPPIQAVLKHPAFFLLAIGSMCSIGAVGGTMLNLKLFLSLDRRLPQLEMAEVLSYVLMFSIAGRLIMGFLADHMAKKYVMLIIYLMVAGALPMLMMPKTPLVLFAVVFGIGLGGDYMIVPLMAAELFGVRVLGRVLGVVLTADGIAEAVVPWAVGSLRDTTGSYTSGFILLIVLAAVGALVAALLPRKGQYA